MKINVIMFNNLNRFIHIHMHWHNVINTYCISTEMYHSSRQHRQQPLQNMLRKIHNCQSVQSEIDSLRKSMGYIWLKRIFMIFTLTIRDLLCYPYKKEK